MSFNMVKDGSDKKITVADAGLENIDDVFNINKNPDEYPKPEDRGIEFLIDEKEDDHDGDDDDDDEDDDEEDTFAENPSNRPSIMHAKEPEKTYEDLQQEKAFYLSKLNRMIKKGNVTTRRFGMEHSLEQIRGEVIRIKKEESIDSGIDYCRQGLMFCISTIEMVDGKYSGSMAGWSQNVMGNIDSYDEVFEELYEKYFMSSDYGPEFKLISMLAGSAFMFNLNKTLHSDVPRPQRDMDGPSMDTDDLLRRLNNEVELDDISSTCSSDHESDVPVIKEQTKTIPIKKTRGRPKKST
jgi:hypothetical protein